MYKRVYVEITNICNKNCSFCHGHSRQPGQMSRENFARILEQLRGQTEYIYYHLMGEPLLHPQLPEFLQMAKQQGYRSVITTNGSLLQKRGAEILAAGVHKVSISLHSFEQADVVGHRDYVQQTAAFADAAARAGVIVCFRLWNKGFDEGKNTETERILRESLPGEWTENSRGYRIRERIFLEWGDRFAWPDKDAEDQGDRVFCYGLQDHFGILCDGTVVPCCLDSEGGIPLGNIFREDIREILASDRATAMAAGFRCRKATEELCRRCGYARKFQ